MPALTQLDEARRWTKFPATLLFATCLLWLVAVLPRVASDWDGTVAQPSETLIGAVVVFLLLVFMPIASPLAAIGMLFLQRSALYLGAVLPFLPLLAVSLSKAGRIVGKFAEYRQSQNISSFGDGVLDALILAGLWLIAVVHVLYVRRALHELGKAEQWQIGGRQRPVKQGSTTGEAGLGALAVSGGAASNVDSSVLDDTCFLLPDALAGEDDD